MVYTKNLIKYVITCIVTIHTHTQDTKLLVDMNFITLCSLQRIPTREVKPFLVSKNHRGITIHKTMKHPLPRIMCPTGNCNEPHSVIQGASLTYITSTINACRVTLQQRIEFA